MTEIENQILELLKPLSMENQNAVLTKVRNTVKETRLFNLHYFEQQVNDIKHNMNGI